MGEPREWYGPCEVSNPAGLPARVWVKDGQVLRVDEQGRVSLHDVAVEPAVLGPEVAPAPAMPNDPSTELQAERTPFESGCECEMCRTSREMRDAQAVSSKVGPSAFERAVTERRVHETAARHQATIDKAFEPADPARDRYGDEAIDRLERLQADGLAAVVDKPDAPNPGDAVAVLKAEVAVLKAEVRGARFGMEAMSARIDRLEARLRR